MKSLKVLILEDNTLTIRDIKNTLSVAGHQQARGCRTVEEAVKAIESEAFDIAMIDIELERGKSGIELANYLNKTEKMPFIFLTSHDDDENFQEASATNPAAYLIKPFKARELGFQLELAYENFPKNQTEKQTLPYIFLPFKGGVKKIDKQKVVYLQARKSSTFIHLEDQETPEYFSVHLGFLEQFFPEKNFVKISRSATINLDFMDELFDGEVLLKFSEKEVRLPVSSKATFVGSLDVVRRPK